MHESNKKNEKAKKGRNHENTRRADFVNARPLRPDELNSKTVFVDKDVESKHAKVIRAFADEHCLNIVSQRVDADCFVVTNPASPWQTHCHGNRAGGWVRGVNRGVLARQGCLLPPRPCAAHSAKAVGLG